MINEKKELQKQSHGKKSFRFLPVTRSRWNDLERLFGPRGACGGCWCMAWRLSPLLWRAGKGESNERKMKSLVERGRSPGILAYDGRQPIGWCSVAPRSEFIALQRSRVLAPIDSANVWSITCLFIAKEYRGKRVSVQLLSAVGTILQKRGARIVEGYPVIPYTRKMPDVFAWTGTYSAFKQAGFLEVARRSRSRPIMRMYLKGKTLS